MALFEIPKRADRQADIGIAKKSNTSRKSTTAVKGGGGLFDRISAIRASVNLNLGDLRDDYVIIQDESELQKYIDECIADNIIAIDTETTGLDPLQDELVGISIYTADWKGAYIPVNHKSYITGIKVENQLSVDFLHEQFQRIADASIDVIMFNACFDTRFLMSGINVRLHCTWDCYLAARLLNENEGRGSNGLKALHNKYVLDGVGDAFSFDDLFTGVTFDMVPINVAYIYAAHDAVITYELYQYQKPFLTSTDSECISRGLQNVAWVFHNIEMPCVDVVVDLENIGVAFDFEYNKQLKEKYHKLLQDRLGDFNTVCNKYADKIQLYRDKNPNCKLENPINIESPTQIAILLYDILGCELPVDKKTKQQSRSTDEKSLKAINNDVTEAVLGYREFSTIVSTFIDKLPSCVNLNDSRIHCKFNQYGADTGRFSSQNPNLQNIPSHVKDIRKMFKATDGYVMLSSDFSQQEGLEFFIVDKWCEVETCTGWKYADKIVVGDVLKVQDEHNLDVEITVTKVNNIVDKNQIIYYYI